MYAEDIKASGHLGSLLAFVNDLLKISSARPVDASRFSIDKFDFDETRTEPQLIEAQALGVHMYYLCLLYLPNLTRTWWFESKNKVKGPLENWTQKQVNFQCEMLKAFSNIIRSHQGSAKLQCQP